MIQPGFSPVYALFVSNSQKIWLTGLIIFVLAVAWFFHRRENLARLGARATSRLSLDPGSRSEATHPQPVSETPAASLSPTPAEALATQKNKAVDAIRLTRGNFESYVRRCFSGETCEFEDSPFEMYQDFKHRGNREAMDRLISVLRNKLRTPEGREAYKDLVRKMIDDFYPANEKLFQEAAYYNYLGDLEKSLSLYLALEKMAERDTSMTRAPTLNIANTFYDLGKYEDSLPYYEKALSETTNSETLRFIDERISEIKLKTQRR